MSDSGKITSSHRSRAAVIYVRQSTLIQLERNTESTARQYDLVHRALQLGWPREAIRVIDGDLGISGSVTGQRAGFEGMVAEIALGQVGIILALEASRLARDNAAWYRLLDLAGVCDTLVADADAVYHPALFGDRLLLGLMGIMAESELHVLRARLEGGIKNKAARGELRRGLPVGLVWGETDGEICFHPDEAVTGVLAAVFDRFAVCGSVRATWLWLRAEGLRWPLQKVAYTRRGSGIPPITWVEPTYHAVHTTLTHPAYAGAYVYGRTRKERYLDPSGALRQRARRLPRDQWEVLIPDHHPGFTDWDTYQANQARIGTNIRPQARQPGTGAVREGCALLQGLATCGTCGRKLAIFYAGPAKCVPNYYCHGSAELVNGRGARHMSVGGQAIDAAVAGAFLAALEPMALRACLQAAEQVEHGHDAALDQHRRQAEQARYHASRAERRYRAVDPDNRLVARGLEAEWEHALRELADAETELTRRQAARPKTLTDGERAAILALGDDLGQVWDAPTTDPAGLLPGSCGEAEFQACEVAGSPPVERGAVPVRFEPQEVEGAGHVHVVEAGFRQSPVACPPGSVRGGLVHGSLDAGAAGVVGLEAGRFLRGPGGGLGFGQAAGRQRELPPLTLGAQLTGGAGPAVGYGELHDDRVFAALGARVP